MSCCGEGSGILEGEYQVPRTSYTVLRCPLEAREVSLLYGSGLVTREVNPEGGSSCVLSGQLRTYWRLLTAPDSDIAHWGI